MTLINKTLRIRLTFLEPILGTVPKSKELYTQFIGQKAADLELDEEEAKTVEDLEESGWTGFHLADPDGDPAGDGNPELGQPFIYDYQLKGFFKDACSMLRRIEGRSKKLTAYKKIIDGMIFIAERRIWFTRSGDVGVLERPLRAQTPQGERVCLAKSDTIPADSSIEFTIQLLDPKNKNVVMDWLEYGQLRGLGQWRNGSYGRFKFEVLKES